MATPDVKVAVIDAAADTSDGTQDFTVSGFGTVKAAIFLSTHNTSFSTSEDHLRQSIGFVAQGRARCITVSDVDNVSTSESFSEAVNACITYLEETTGLLDRWANFDSFITDGVRVDWASRVGESEPRPATEITVILLGGDDLQANVRDHEITSASGSKNITDIGFEADHVIGIGVGDRSFVNAVPNPIAGFASARPCWGVVANNGGGDIDQLCHSMFLADGKSTTENAGYFDSNAVYRRITDSATGARLQLGTFDSSGFTATISNDDSTDLTVAFLALKYDNNAITGHSVHDHRPPQVTGNDSDTTPGFKPQALIFGPTNLNAQNSRVTNVLAGVMGTGAVAGISSQVEKATSATSRDNVSTTATANRTELVTILGRNQVDGAIYEAEFVSFDALGFTLDYTDAAPATRRVLALVIGTLLFSGSGTAALPGLGAAGVAQVVFSGSGTAVLSGLGAAGVAQVVHTGSGAVALPGLGASGVGQVVHRGSGTAALPTLAAAGVAQVVFTAAGIAILPTLGAAGVVAIIHRAAGIAPLPGLSAAGVGQVFFTGAGVAIIPGLGAAGTGVIEVFPIQCTTFLTGQRDIRTELTGIRDLVVALTGCRDVTVALTACRDLIVALTAQRDVQTDLTGIRDLIVALTGQRDVVVALTGQRDVVVALTAQRDVQTDLSGTRDVVVALTGRYDVRTELKGNLC